MFLKENYYPQTNFMRFVSIMLIISIYCYIVLYQVFDSLVTQPRRFSFTYSFTKHVVLLTPSFSLLFRLNATPLSHAVVVTSPNCFLVGDFRRRIH